MLAKELEDLDRKSMIFKKLPIHTFCLVMTVYTDDRFVAYNSGVSVFLIPTCNVIGIEFRKLFEGFTFLYEKLFRLQNIIEKC